MALERGSIEVEEVGEHAVVIALSGDWSAAEIETFTARAAEAVAARKRCIVADLSDVSFLDSRVLHALLHLHRASEGGAWTFHVVRPSNRALWRSFEVTGLDTRLPSFQTRASALLAAP